MRNMNKENASRGKENGNTENEDQCYFSLFRGVLFKPEVQAKNKVHENCKQKSII